MFSTLIILAMLTRFGYIDGHYVSQHDEQVYFDIRKIDDKNIKFQASSYWVGANPDMINTGEISGIIPLKEGKAIYNDNFGDETQGCHVEITFKEDSTLRVEDNYRCGGLNVTFMGDYKRKSFQILK